MATNLNIVLTAQTSAATAALNKAAKSTDNVTNAINRSGNAARKMGNQFNSTAVSVNKFGKGVMQQAGYQVADFAVQVQNGTSAVQAFGQQGSQMLAIFGPVGAILGAAVAVGSALATVFLGMGKSSKDAANNIDDLNKAIGNVATTYDTSVASSLQAAKEDFGDLSDSAIRALDSLRAFAREQMFEDFIKKINSATEAFEDTNTEAAQLFNAAQVGAPRTESGMQKFLSIVNFLTEELAKSGVETEGLFQNFQQLQGAIDKFKKGDDLSPESAKEFAGQLNNSRQALYDAGAITKDFNKQLLGAVQLAFRLSRDLRQATGKKTDTSAAKELSEEFDKQTKLVNQQTNSFAQTLKSIEKQTEELRLRNELFGKSKDLIESELIFRQEIERLTKDGNKLTLEEINAVRARIDELLREKEILTEKQETLKAQQELQKKIAKEREEANKRAEEEQKRINELMADGFKTVGDAISGLISKTTSWKEALSAVLKKVIDIASKMGTTKSGGFSFNKLFNIGAKLLPSLFGAPTTPFGPTTGPMFPGLMDFHTGGIVGGKAQKGMRSDERMIVARTGERVLNRGQAMMSEQGGTGSGVVVNQTINISTGVQQTVRAEIMSMAPQIAAQAKSAVLDARRRGGGFSAAFA